MSNETLFSSNPLRILQFGEGNFLRAFLDVMVQRLNESGHFKGSIVMLKPRDGSVERFTQQNCRYTVVERGLDDGELRENYIPITCIKDCLNPYQDWQKVQAMALEPTLRFVFSNTTEAGIEYRQLPFEPNCCPATYPAKLASLLYHRYCAGLPGLLILPCELIENNGQNLQRIVLQHAADWQLPRDFTQWIKEKCQFYDSLVDRIVSGMPENPQKMWDKIGYEDKLLVCCETYLSLYLQGNAQLLEELPLHLSGYHVQMVADIAPYRALKVRFLNGAHTSSVLAGILAGYTYVADMVSVPVFSRFLNKLMLREIAGTIALPQDKKEAFAWAVLERFRNPTTMHKLSSIALNSVSKWRVRVLPSLLDYFHSTGKLPLCTCFSLAALLRYYMIDAELMGHNGNTSYTVNDDPNVLQFFAQAAEKCNGEEYVQAVLGNEDLWGQNLDKVPGLTDLVSSLFYAIKQSGIISVMESLRGQTPTRHTVIHPQDNVAVAFEASDDVPVGHKFALCNISRGEAVIKYGMPIGTAREYILQGDHVHTHNLQTNLKSNVTYAYDGPPRSEAKVHTNLTFRGYRRPDGKVGIRNHLFVVPLVGCINKLAEHLAAEINRELPEGCDTALALTHPYGCSQLGGDHAMTQALLAALCCHPNAGGVLVLGLGCENNTMESFREKLGNYDQSRMRFLVAQQVQDEVQAGMDMLRELASLAAQDKRSDIPLSELIVGLKCGGSDGFSGITANPLLGRFSDAITSAGASTLLSEVPEMFGAETLLMARCTSKEVFDKCVSMINGFKQYFEGYGQPIYENPSPGNKAGGISTLEDKSLGCIQKAGQAPVVDVLSCGQRISAKGLNLVNGPGNDMVATTILAAAGAHLVLFTTGRGTPFGGVVPTLKVATNSNLARLKPHWIDFDAEPVLNSKQEMDEAFLKLVLSVASGQQVQNEKHGYEEIAIFKNGVTL